jgi:hypothetical protein
MAQEIERVLYHAEDFLRRNLLRPKSAREAQKRRARRKLEAVLRRLRRAGFILAGLLAALVLASIVTEIGLLTWIFAVPTIFLLAFLSLFWPARRRHQPATAGAAAMRPLQEMAVRVEVGLIALCPPPTRSSRASASFSRTSPRSIPIPSPPAMRAG